MRLIETGLPGSVASTQLRPSQCFTRTGLVLPRRSSPTAQASERPVAVTL